MKQLAQEIKWFLSNKLYVITLCIVSACSYGYAVIQPIIGIDDTATVLYFQDGLTVVMGRWTIFLLNKFLNIAEFSPFMIDLIGVLLLMLAATLFCVLWRRIFGSSAGIWGYAAFACLFISNPIISEVFIYYCHNGIGLGYVLIALALLAFMDALDNRKIKPLLVSLLCLWIAMGCYESLAIVYILGLILILFFRGLVDKGRLRTRNVLGSLAAGAVIVLLSFLLRSIILWLFIRIFHLQDIVGLQSLRSLSEMGVLFDGGSGLGTLLMLIKRFWLVYYVNAIVYLPVTGYAFAMLFIGLFSVVVAVRRKNIWYPVLVIGMGIAPFLLTLAEARLTYYRSCQYLPFFVAAVAFIIYMLLRRFACAHKGTARYVKLLAGLAVFIVIFNQAAYMNKCFYMDYTKYEDTKETLTDIAMTLEKECDTSKPVVFTGHYEVPHDLIKDFYVEYSSWQFKWISRITDLVDVHLKEKYYTPYGYNFGGESYWPFIQWAFEAFDGTNREMIRFLEMHGHSFTTVTDKALLEEAQTIGASMPKWPAQGSLVEYETYIIINF